MVYTHLHTTPILVARVLGERFLLTGSLTGDVVDGNGDGGWVETAGYDDRINVYRIYEIGRRDSGGGGGRGGVGV